jgi:hypothetical protein
MRAKGTGGVCARLGAGTLEAGNMPDRKSKNGLQIRRDAKVSVQERKPAVGILAHSQELAKYAGVGMSR